MDDLSSLTVHKHDIFIFITICAECEQITVVEGEGAGEEGGGQRRAESVAAIEERRKTDCRKMEEEGREGSWEGGNGDEVEEGTGRGEGGTWGARLRVSTVGGCVCVVGVCVCTVAVGSSGSGA